ncbi:hypothetical protein AAMO2058_001600800 [Amorphochlora amoebiformis]
MCYDKASCLTRQLRSPRRTSSRSHKHYPESLNLSGIFAESQVLPLYGYHAGFVAYCTSDAYLSDTHSSSFQFPEELREKFPGGFRGARVVRAALDALRSLGLRSPAHLVLGGCSAGARGALAHLDFVSGVESNNHSDAGYLGKGVRVSGFLDSPLWVDIQPSSKSLVSLREKIWKFSKIGNIDKMYGSRCREEIARRYGKDSLGEMYRCAFPEEMVKHVKTPFFLIQNQLDSYQLRSLGVRKHTATGINKTEKNRLRVLLRTKITTSGRTSPSAGFFSPACERHCVSLKNSNLNAISVENTTLPEAYEQFLEKVLRERSGKNDVTGFPSEPLRWIDTCQGSLPCGLGCGRGKRTFSDRKRLWEANGRRVVKVGIEGVLSEIENGFVCVNLDWWPDSKCDYGTCPWTDSSLLTLDLENKYIVNAVKALGPGVRLRLGGSLSDFITYEIDKGDCNLPAFIQTNTTRLGYAHAGTCLPWSRWEAFHEFCRKANCELIFQLNALRGRVLKEECPAKTDCRHNFRKNPCCWQWEGSWDSSNVQAFLRKSKEKGLHVFAWQFGNELNGKKGLGAHLTPEEYADGLHKAMEMMSEVWNASGKPKIMGPNGHFDPSFDARFLSLSETDGNSPELLLTHHMYTLGGGFSPKVEKYMLDVNKLDRLHRKAAAAINLAKAANVRAWVGEAGGAYNSGRPGATNAFMSSFWYNHNMGVLSASGYSGFCRQSLIGGHYNLLSFDRTKPNETSVRANPDYFSALLWRKLVGNHTLRVYMNNKKTGIRVYAFCAPELRGITLLVLNFNSERYTEVRLRNSDLRKGERVEYHLTSRSLKSRKVFLNGEPLFFYKNATLPNITSMGITLKGGSPLIVEPHSIVFVQYKDVLLDTCTPKSPHQKLTFKSMQFFDSWGTPIIAVGILSAALLIVTLFFFSFRSKKNSIMSAHRSLLNNPTAPKVGTTRTRPANRDVS